MVSFTLDKEYLEGVVRTQRSKVAGIFGLACGGGADDEPGSAVFVVMMWLK